MSQSISQLIQNMLRMTWRSLASLGFLVVLIAGLIVLRPDLRFWSQWQLLSLLQNDTVNAAQDNGSSHHPVLKSDLELPHEQEKLARFLGKKYKLAQAPVREMVAGAFDAAADLKLEPSLILAVASVESNLNPYAKNSSGALGLMQVKSSYNHWFSNFGGKFAAFDPVSNLQVGAKKLSANIKAQGSLEKGLLSYTSERNVNSGSYVQRVMLEKKRIEQVLAGIVPGVQTALAPTLDSVTQ